MEPFDDRELKRLLQEWEAPGAPPELERRVLRPRRGWWQWLMTGSIRIPVPACLGAIALLAILWGYSGRPAPSPPPSPPVRPELSLADFKPVVHIEPRIVGSVK
jgi:hypothetical protein